MQLHTKDGVLQPTWTSFHIDNIYSGSHSMSAYMDAFARMMYLLGKCYIYVRFSNPTLHPEYEVHLEDVDQITRLAASNNIALVWSGEKKL